MLTKLQKKGKEAGLIMNLDETKILSKTPEQSNIEIDNISIEFTDNIIYLGQLIIWNSRMMKEINKRITLAWNKF